MPTKIHTSPPKRPTPPSKTKVTVDKTGNAVTFSNGCQELPNKYMDKHMMDGNNQMMPQDGMGPNNSQHMYQNCQNQMMPQGQNGQVVPQGQMPPQGQPPQQPSGNAPQQTPNGGAQAQ